MSQRNQIITVERHEDKYLIPVSCAIEIQKRLRVLCQADSHNKGTFGYRIRSLYLDDINNSDFEEKLAGIRKRKKIRLRIYDEKGDIVKFEVKQKYGDLQKKISCLINKKEAEQIIQGDLSSLYKRLKDNDEAFKAYLHMNSKGKKSSVVLIEYDRCAYILPCNNTRITIDRNIRCAEYYQDLFALNPPYRPILNRMAVLEVKYNDCLVSTISDYLTTCGLTQCSVSKYCMGRPFYYDYFY